MPSSRDFGDDVREALALLGIERLVLSIHQTSFPAGDGDLGCGTPYSRAGLRFLELVRGLGFTGVSLGPAGVTSKIDASPYDGTWFGINPMFLDPLSTDAPLAASAPSMRVDYEEAWDRSRALAASLAARGVDVQEVLVEQHRRMRDHARALGLRVYADAQIGLSDVEARENGALFLPGYAMGAPPSRTNPDGQPWGYPVFDPEQMEPGGAAYAFVARRFDELLSLHDGLRVDHPHGWVCPWVYRSDVDDALLAVQQGARLFESPDLADHPALAPLARVSADQIDRGRPRYADDWVRALTPQQIDRYGVIFDLVMERASAHGVDKGDLIVEVLSTCPRPLAAVLARHGLGRFRVTQKARVDEPHDVYRSDNAEPADWILAGNHDTPPLRLVIEGWDGAERERRARWLTFRLGGRASTAERSALKAALVDDDGALAEAMIAELFCGPAKNVSVFWVDLFGERGVYNRPGVVHPDNWKMRVPPDPARALDDAVAAGRAPHLGRALALALRARGTGEDRLALAERLARGPGRAL